MSLVTTSLMAQQKQANNSKDLQNVLLANSITASNDISPSFANTSIPGAKAAAPDGGPMTFEPASFA